MTQSKKEEAREERITMEIVVDAYDEMERSLGWYYYLDEKLQFPFTAKCNGARATSPLEKGERVEVTGMPPEDECECEMFVNVAWQGRTLAVPLSQLDVVKANAETREAVADWHYWVKMGYEF
ncbi:MAG: calcium-binding protein [Pyrinomonadaceae bacterium MAG19_C2-C3]|nr:calcium-binding protein [Pyrinomonadaceae bacterium MAG19_C2-C3]